MADCGDSAMMNSSDASYYRARYYDPGTGRFASEDPIKFYSGVNFYIYALNFPAYWIDPTGYNVTIKVYPGNQPAGHIGLGVNSDETVGYYPNHDTGASPGHIEPDDPNKEGSPESCMIILTTPDQDQRIQNFINTRRKSPRWWRPGNDCANFVHDALKAGGIKVDDSTFPRSVFGNLQQLPHTSCFNVTPIL